MTTSEEEKFTMFRNRLTKVYRHLGKQARRQGVSCYRIYDHDLPEFPLCMVKNYMWPSTNAIMG